MIIKPKIKGKHAVQFFCAKCGKKVPFEKKYFTHFYQKKMKGINRWIVSFEYICPDCGTTTNIPHLDYSVNLKDKIKKFNLYGEYN